MVELKTSVYDEHNPPLVPATLASHNADPIPLEPEPRLASHPPPFAFSAGLNSVPTPTQNNDQPNRNIEEEPKDPRMVASGVAGAVLGFMFGGPILATLFGFGSAYATQKTGATGDAARALGDVAIVAKVKAEEIDKKHNVVDKSKQVAADAWEQAKEYDRKHNVLEQAKEFAVFSWKSFTKFAQDHRLLERSVNGVGRGLDYVADRVTGDGDDGTDNNTSSRPPRR